MIFLQNPNISGLALALLSLTFSNASVEWIFSQMNVVRTKLRNHLRVCPVEDLLQITYGLSHYIVSINFEPPDDMLRHFIARGSEEVEEGNTINSPENVVCKINTSMQIH